MTYELAVVSFITFLIMMIFLEKGKGRVSNFLKNVSFFKLIILTILFIAAMIGVSAWMQNFMCAAAATVSSSCLLLWRFREYVDHWKKV
jgi:NADH:ubiquinone oxidoreductase subunit 6 (subunit J)